MPLVEAGAAGFAVRRGDVRREVEGVVVDALDFEARREVVVVLGQRAAPEDVHLRLRGDGRPVGEPVDGGAVVRGEEGVDAVREAAGGLVGVEASGEFVLLLRPEHLGLAFEDEQFVFVESGVDDLEFGICEVVEIDAVDRGAEVDVALWPML